MSRVLESACTLHTTVFYVFPREFITHLSVQSRQAEGAGGEENPLCKVGHGVRGLVSG